MSPSVVECVVAACIWEVTARKVGNVHPDRGFKDLTVKHFMQSVTAINPAFALARQQPVGQTILQAIKATRDAVHTNTNLGIVLLLAPLAAVPPERSLREGIGPILERLSVDDSRKVFEAIRLAHPGGLGKAEAEDVHAEPTLPLRAVMALAAERDLVARQYHNGFHEVLDEGLPYLQSALREFDNVTDAIVATHLYFMAQHPDSLIARRFGLDVAREAGCRAGEVLKAHWPKTPDSRRLFQELDDWLTSTNPVRNPGTSA
ncbi:MAG: triphosphoribosyl-dephospho-CoA synthase, partial [Gemmataceae bacterium]|nr:triphosphoribosyl-dephospho-CoA synthase [Gemmataceae bacterium]